MRVALEAAYWRFKGFLKPGTSTAGDLPADVVHYLQKSNLFLKELKNRYAQATNLPHSFWAPWEEKVDLLKFRGENDYVSQAYFRNTHQRYEVTCTYVEAEDELGLLDALKEDALFGCKTWDFIPSKPVSRDLMDSILEITFLQKALGLGLKDSFRMLDIGAGYGRFAHRFTTAFTGTKVSCIDAVATSTFISDFYLRFRKCDRTKVVPFDKIADLKPGTIDLASNMHSWSECTNEFIAWWLDRICELNIPYLFIIPHTETLATIEPDGSSKPYDEQLAKRGFKLVLKQRKFHRSQAADKVGIFPADYRLYKRETK